MKHACKHDFLDRHNLSRNHDHILVQKLPDTNIAAGHQFNITKWLVPHYAHFSFVSFMKKSVVKYHFFAILILILSY